MMTNFKRGLFLGSVVGAALVAVFMSESGQRARRRIMYQVDDVYEKVKDEVVKSGVWDKMTNSRFAEMVRDIVDKYGAENGLSQRVRRSIACIVGTEWRNMRDEISKEKKHKEVPSELSDRRMP